MGLDYSSYEGVCISPQGLSTGEVWFCDAACHHLCLPTESVAAGPAPRLILTVSVLIIGSDVSAAPGMCIFTKPTAFRALPHCEQTDSGCPMSDPHPTAHTLMMELLWQIHALSVHTNAQTTLQALWAISM